MDCWPRCSSRVSVRAKRPAPSRVIEGMRRLLVSACLLASACTSALPAPAPTVAPTAPPAALSPTTRIVALGNGIAVDIPERWTFLVDRPINKATWQLVLASNGDLTGLATRPGNGDVSASALPPGRVVVEVESICSLMCVGPAA